jgi:DUF4097 and DUF4098 domain-containing protein YvlB
MNTKRFLLIAVSFTCVLACGSTLASVAEETVENTYSVAEKANITVKNADGRIQVYGWEENEVKVTAYKRAFTKERLDAIEINVQIEADSVLIDTIYPPAAEGSITADRSGTVDYIILVPQYATLTRLELANGELLVEGMRGASISAHVGNGKLLLRNSFSPTEVTLTKGIMDLFFNWWEDTGCSLTATLADGNMILGLPGTAALRLDAESATGRIEDRFQAEADRGEDERALNLLIGYESGSTLKLRTNSGNIRINKLY